MTESQFIGRLLRASTTGYVFGCSTPEPEAPLFGAFVRAQAQQGRSEVIGLIYNIAIADDPFVKQMAATPDLDEVYIQDQRLNRQVPIEVSVLAIGYRIGSVIHHGLPPQPPVALDRIHLCAAAEVLAFTARLDFIRLVLAAADAPADELLAVSLREAAALRPPADRLPFLRTAGAELARLLSRDLARVDNLLRRLKD